MRSSILGNNSTQGKSGKRVLQWIRSQNEQVNGEKDEEEETREKIEAREEYEKRTEVNKWFVGASS